MKKHILFFLLFTSFIISIGCQKNNTPTPNDTQCNYNGLIWYDTIGNSNIYISDSNLNTQFFMNASNGPYGDIGIEIAGSDANGEFIHFVTNVITTGSSGLGYITLSNTGQTKTVNVSCIRSSGQQVGDEYKYDVEVGGNYMFEYCVKIDEVL